MITARRRAESLVHREACCFGRPSSKPIVNHVYERDVHVLKGIDYITRILSTTFTGRRA